MRVLLAYLVLAFHASAYAHEPPRQEVAFDAARSAIGQEVPALSFTASDGRRIDLADLRGRPLLVSLVYTGCADLRGMKARNALDVILRPTTTRSTMR